MHFTSWFLAEENDSSIDVTVEGKETKTVKLNKTKVLFVAVPLVAAITAVAFVNLVLVAAILGVLVLGIGVLEIILRTVAYVKSRRKVKVDSEEAAPEEEKADDDVVLKTEDGVIPTEELKEKVNALNKHFNGEDKGASPGDDIAPAGAL